MDLTKSFLTISSDDDISWFSGPNHNTSWKSVDSRTLAMAVILQSHWSHVIWIGGEWLKRHAANGNHSFYGKHALRAPRKLQKKKIPALNFFFLRSILISFMFCCTLLLKLLKSLRLILFWSKVTVVT